MPDTNNDPFIDPSTLPVEPPVELIKKPIPVEVTEKQKENFFKAFLSDTPYQEEFSLLNGSYRVVLRAMTNRENSELLKQIAYDRDQNRIDGVNDYYFTRVGQYRLALTIVSINEVPFLTEINSQTNPWDKKNGVSYISARADTFADWSMPKLAAVQGLLAEFDQRVITLVDAVSKSDFWKAGA